MRFGIYLVENFLSSPAQPGCAAFHRLVLPQVQGASV
jgi:hypothetical protein